MSEKSEQPIIIKKIKKGGHGGHHGGAWKVAYADFVTAMMAFFLVMWILGLNDETRKRIASYVSDPGVFSFETGKRLPVDMLNNAPAQYEFKSGRGSKFQPSPAELSEDFNNLTPEQRAVFFTEIRDSAAVADSVAYMKVLVDKEQEILEKLETSLKEKPAFQDLLNSVEVKLTDEGLRIELLETSESVFFELGSARLTNDARAVLDLLADELIRLPNTINLEGHTDSRPFGQGNGYSNWELSADRANAARRYLERKGLGFQIRKVVGFADKQPRTPNNPFDPSNRRISILVAALTTDDVQQ